MALMKSTSEGSRRCIKEITVCPEKWGMGEAHDCQSKERCHGSRKQTAISNMSLKSKVKRADTLYNRW